MKVFTSIFVLEGVPTTFDDLELSVLSGQEDAEIMEESDGIRRRIVELHARIGQRRERARREEA